MAKPGDILKLMGSAKVTKPRPSESSKFPKPSSSFSHNSASKASSPAIQHNDWTIVGSHLVYRTPSKPPPALVQLQAPVKIAAFDLDGTLVDTKSGNRFAFSSTDWRWFNESVTGKIAEYREKGFLVVIFTNQGGVVLRQSQKSYLNFVNRVSEVVKKMNVEEEVFVFAAPKRPAVGKKGTEVVSSKEEHELYRKPQGGMWEELLRVLKRANRQVEIDLDKSFYCGDAAGRRGDFSDSDLEFARRIGLKFCVPEEVFV